jgi:hypothetical protein
VGSLLGHFNAASLRVPRQRPILDLPCCPCSLLALPKLHCQWHWRCQWQPPQAGTRLAARRIPGEAPPWRGRPASGVVLGRGPLVQLMHCQFKLAQQPTSVPPAPLVLAADQQSRQGAIRAQGTLLQLTMATRTWSRQTQAWAPGRPSDSGLDVCQWAPRMVTLLNGILRQAYRHSKQTRTPSPGCVLKWAEAVTADHFSVTMLLCMFCCSSWCCLLNYLAA